MKKTVVMLSLLFVYLVGTTFARTPSNKIQRVLLISVDGMHAVDYLNCSTGISTANNNQPFCPAMAALGLTGVNYVAASTSKPSDSFPGVTAIVTGGSPALTGVYYDVAYARNYNAPPRPQETALPPVPALPMGRLQVLPANMKKASTSTRPS
jgi:predicted AlkP superfamily pyrophosphatase or phosphodiesterase